MPNDYETLMHRWFEEVWNQKSESAVDEMFAADGIGHGLTDPEGNDVIRGPEGFKKLQRAFLSAYPDLKVEFSIHYGLIDIVAERFDAGVRVGDQVAKDMIAVRISADFNMTVVGSPSYFAARKVPTVPQDLTEHSCINLRLPTHGGLYAWEFEKEGQELSVHVQGQVILNTSPEIVTAALEGYGLAYIPQDVADRHIATGHLVQVLEDWRPTYPGYHLYYPSRRNASPAFLLVLNALRLKA